MAKQFIFFITKTFLSKMLEKSTLPNVNIFLGKYFLLLYVMEMIYRTLGVKLVGTTRCGAGFVVLTPSPPF